LANLERNYCFYPITDSRHVQEILPGSKHYYLASNLRENIMYQFSVRARTSVDWGPPVSKNITIGPQPGSPEKTGVPVLTPGESSVTLSWVNGNHGDSNITGYIIQASEKGGSFVSSLFSVVNAKDMSEQTKALDIYCISDLNE
jgi:hypothetical protein